MEGLQRENRAFNFFERHPIFPHIYKKEGLIDNLGFKSIESSREDLISFKNFFNSTYTKDSIVDTRFLSGFRTIDNDQRKTLPFPQFQVLEKDGQKFFKLTFDGISIITGNQPVSCETEKIEGYELKHFFVEGQDGQVLDLLSFRTGDIAKNILSFAGGRGLFGSRWTDQKTGEEYEPEILLKFPVKTNNHQMNWDSMALVYLFLHENTHAAIWTKTAAKESSARTERKVNALALQYAKKINALYPLAHFFDTDYQKEWIEQQLQEGYDPKCLSPWMSFENLASNKIRAESRKILNDFTSRKPPHRQESSTIKELLTKTRRILQALQRKRQQ